MMQMMNINGRTCYWFTVKVIRGRSKPLWEYFQKCHLLIKYCKLHLFIFSDITLKDKLGLSTSQDFHFLSRSMEVTKNYFFIIRIVEERQLHLQGCSTEKKNEVEQKESWKTLFF